MGKQPKLVLRESAVHDATRNWPAGRFLEMGAGTGHMGSLFLDRGFTGVASDLGDDSREMIRANLARYGNAARVVDRQEELGAELFDYLFAFEVLEHIEDDAGVLQGWTRQLRPDGRLLLTVPAHQRKFGRSDVLVGHVRRYEKSQLEALLRAAGYVDIEIASYGYPLTELTRRVSNAIVADDRSYDDMSAEQRSIRSAQAQPSAIARVLALVGDRWVTPFRWLQRAFYRTDLGDGYVAHARKA